jgi:hypothetical protein
MEKLRYRCSLTFHNKLPQLNWGVVSNAKTPPSQNDAAKTGFTQYSNYLIQDTSYRPYTTSRNGELIPGCGKCGGAPDLMRGKPAWRLNVQVLDPDILPPPRRAGRATGPGWRPANRGPGSLQSRSRSQVSAKSPSTRLII